MGAAYKDRWRKQIEDMLERYPIYKQSIEEHIIDLFPSMTVSYSERVSGGQSEYASSTERHGVQRAEPYILVKKVEFALGILTDKEREVIDKSFFGHRSYDENIYYMSESTFYRTKKKALRRMAEALFLTVK